MVSNNHKPCTDPATTTPHLVERRTGLRGQHIGAAPVPRGSMRRQTLALLNERDPEIPYVKFETALRGLVCSFMERQDRMNEELLRRMIDLQYRMEDIEADLPVASRKEQSIDAGAPK
jgi:hypothetical protein